MSIIAPVIILILAMLIQAFLQLVPGTFMLFEHHALGKKSTKNTDLFNLYFILGNWFFIATIWLIIYIFITAFFCNQVGFRNNQIASWIMALICIAESIFVAFFYYRKGKGTALFIPRSIVNNTTTHINKVKSRSDAFVLGFVSGFPELPLTIPLYIITITELLKIPPSSGTLTIVFWLLISAIPIASIRIMYGSGFNLASIERFRIRIKPFIRVILCLGFSALAFIIFYIGVLHG